MKLSVLLQAQFSYAIHHGLKITTLFYIPNLDSKDVITETIKVILSSKPREKRCKKV